MSTATKATDTLYTVTENQQSDAIAGKQECVGKCRRQLHRHRPLAFAQADRGTTVHADKPVCSRLVTIAANDSPLPACGLAPVNMTNVVTRLVIAHVQKLAPTLPKDALIVVNLSGRGDKDVEEVRMILDARKQEAH